MGYTNVFRDPRGFPDWQAAGLPVETSPGRKEKASSDPGAPGVLYGWAMVWTLLGVFVGGIALNLTPCVYPLIPVTVSYFSGRSGARRELAFHAALYIGGLAVTNSVMGVVAALTGSLMGAALQNPAVLAVVAIVLVFFASSLFGLWELRLPQGLTTAASKSFSGYFGSLFMGLTLGVVAAPCVGPFVLGLLTWVAGTGSPLLGFLVFFTLSLGLGLPLFALAVFSGSLDRLPGSGEWMLWVRKAMGWVLIGMAVYFIKPLLPEVAGVLALAGTAACAGLHLGWIDRTQAAFRGFSWLKSLAGTAALVIAVYLIGAWFSAKPEVAWQPYSERAIAEAAKSKKPVVIDFFAGWCHPCRQLDATTFRDPGLVKEAAGNFVMIRVDLTTRDSALHDRLIERYGLKGVPTVVFLDSAGAERSDLRLSRYGTSAEFLSRMAQLKGRP